MDRKLIKTNLGIIREEVHKILDNNPKLAILESLNVIGKRLYEIVEQINMEGKENDKLAEDRGAAHHV